MRPRIMGEVQGLRGHMVIKGKRWRVIRSSWGYRMLCLVRRSISERGMGERRGGGRDAIGNEKLTRANNFESPLLAEQST